MSVHKTSLPYFNASPYILFISLVGYLKPCLLHPQTCSANYTFIPYMVTPHHKVYCCESSLMKGLTELMQPSFEMLLGPICMPLLDRFIQLLKVSQANSQ